MQDKPTDGDTPSPWMLKSEVAAEYRTSTTTVDEMVRDGVLPAYRIGNLLRFKRSEVQALITPAAVK